MLHDLLTWIIKFGSLQFLEFVKVTFLKKLLGLLPIGLLHIDSKWPAAPPALTEVTASLVYLAFSMHTHPFMPSDLNASQVNLPFSFS